MQQKTVDGVADGGRQLAYKKPFRQARRGLRLPLRINLPHERKEQHGGTSPPDQFN